MPCDTVAVTPESKAIQKKALADLKKALKAKTAKVVIAKNGAIAFSGWNGGGFLSDTCAFRKLRSEGSSELREAIADAERGQARKIDEKAIASGFHSHDGGNTWGPGHG